MPSELDSSMEATNMEQTMMAEGTYDRFSDLKDQKAVFTTLLHNYCVKGRAYSTSTLEKRLPHVAET